MHVYLHAGHFKTGTTAFQQLLQQHGAALRQQAIYVPSMPHGNHGYHLQRDAATDEMGAGLAAELAHASAQGFASCILSAEVVSHFDEAELAALGRLLAPYPTTLVLVLRHWYSFLPSRYAQNVRRCDAMRADQYVERLIVDGVRHPDASYGLIVERAQQVFTEICVLPYEADAAARSILARAGVDAAEVARMIAATPPANVSLDAELTEIIRAANALVCAHLGLPPDQKYAQVFRRARPITVLNLDSWLPAWLQQRPEAHAALRDVVRRHACTVDLGALHASIADWWAHLQRTARLPRVDWRLSAGFADAAATRIQASTAEPADLPASLRTELLDAALQFLRRG